MIPLAAASVGLGALQAINGYYGLNKLNQQPYPEYSVSPEMLNSYNRAEGMANMGYTPDESTSFRDSLSRSNATAYRNAVNMSGGNLASAINRGINSNNIGALNNFASNDAQLRRQNMRYADQLGQGISNQRNMIAQAAMRRREMLEQAYGNAMQAGLNNIVGPLNLTQAMGSGSPSGAGYNDVMSGYNLSRINTYNPYDRPDNTYGLNELPPEQ